MRPALRTVLLGGGRKPVTPAIQAAHTDMLNRVQAVEASLKEITESAEYQALKNAQSGAIGHNNPPEKIAEAPLDGDLIDQVQNALQLIKSQAASPNDRGRHAKNAVAVLDTQREKLSVNRRGL
jgi:hypothetical protein